MMIQKVLVRNYIAFIAVMFLICPLSTKAETVSFSDVEWEQLNPARGDKSPKAGTLWGDRKANVPTGFLVQFVDGFSSPPHIHNVSYRGVVINGLIHNDDPNAGEMWMPRGSFWTQPKGEVHITAAKGETNVAYIEIEEGPYLVHPVEKAFDSGGRPINVDASNIVWLGLPDVSDAEIAYLWGNPHDGRLYGTFVKLTAGFVGKLLSSSSTFRAVVIQGKLRHSIEAEIDVQNLGAGSYFSSDLETTHHVSCKEKDTCVVYVRTDGKYEIKKKVTKKR